MNRDDQQENTDITKRLEKFHDRLLDAVIAAQAAHPDCPPVPRIMKGWLLPHEKTHIANCPFCRRVTVKKPILRPTFIWVAAAAVAAVLLLYVVSRVHGMDAEFASLHKTHKLNRESSGQLSLLGTVGDAWMARLSPKTAILDARIGPTFVQEFDDQRLALAQIVSPRILSRFETVQLDLSRNLAPGTLARLSADDSRLAQFVSPGMFLKLAKMDERTAASLSPEELLQFSALRLRTARIASPPQLLKAERLKAQLLTKLPPDVVLELTETNLHTAEICGPAVLEFLLARAVDSVDRVGSAVLVEQAHRYSEMATKAKISRSRLRTIAMHDYDVAIAQNSKKGNPIFPEDKNE